MKTSFVLLISAIYTVCADNATSQAHLHDIEMVRDRLVQAIQERAKQLDEVRFGNASKTNTVPVTPNGPIDLAQLQSAVAQAQHANLEHFAKMVHDMQAQHAHEQSEERPPVRGVFSMIFNKPRTYFKVVRVDRRILVDENNQPRGVAGEDVHKALYMLHSGHLHRIFATDTTFHPRNSAFLGSQPQALFAGERTRPNIDGHRMLQAILLALSASTFLFVVAYSVGHVLQSRREEAAAPKYSRMPQEPPVVAVVPEAPDAADRLLASEEKRMETELPAVPQA